MLKRGLLSLVLVALLAGTFMVAPQEVKAAPQKSPEMPGLLGTRDYSFDCIVPKFGAGRCGNDLFTMSAGKYARVNLVSAGANACATFYIVNAASGSRLASKYLCPGNTETIWTNTTGQTVQVYFEADATPIVRTQLQGKYIFGEF
ncbi:MAG: hypothetical protein GFH27_549285n303 [Chloroflexi bacterium AL-W]|nr:hypothetical protein [Chloroflexi bacterium AL-N1]NOK65815.1 hypothetical protein [Chloroflexi bacterium AL-N10]NOK74244.1 hypothetical protein [Chloroflexi bacterium AL-N5]NOK80848.1 hypothetical protein [Chloroflexi bacterium AL-W]NOK88502.1 hypothetical protein [Chloroflexi bacterium AL-N15]